MGTLIKLSNNDDQFKELMMEIKYATNLVKKKKFTLGQYYDHMADFFDHIERPQDADSLRLDAKTWEIEKGEKQ